MTDDPIVWYVEQLDYVERVALTARDDEHAGWWWDNLQTPAGKSIDRHIALHNPNTALAEVEAKRRRLERHRPDEDPFHGVICAWCSVPQAGAYQSWPCPDIRDDAAVYSGAVGYQEGWKP